MPTLQRDVVIIGSGFAGAATAFHLSALTSQSIAIIDKEEIPGSHASGRNASLLLQSVSHPLVRTFAATSRRAFCHHRDKIGYSPVGSLLLGSRDSLEQIRDEALIDTAIQMPRAAREKLPVLEGHRFPYALWTPTDGTLDIWALLNFYLDGARHRGVDVFLGWELLEAEEGASWRLLTSGGEIIAGTVVIAAGAWSSHVATLLGASPLSLTAFKRHLFLLDEAGPLNPNWPYAWSLDKGFYLRSEGDSLLFCACDEEASPSLQETVTPGIHERAAELILAELPRLRSATVRSVWSCFRTKAPDNIFVIGHDPGTSTVFWVAGLGGHGVGCSWEVGRQAAELLTGSATREHAVSPLRLLA